METSPLLPDARWLRLERIQFSSVLITIIAATAPPTAACLAADD